MYQKFFPVRVERLTGHCGNIPANRGDARLFWLQRGEYLGHDVGFENAITEHDPFQSVAATPVVSVPAMILQWDQAGKTPRLYA